MMPGRRSGNGSTLLLYFKLESITPSLYAFSLSLKQRSTALNRQHFEHTIAMFVFDVESMARQILGMSSAELH